MNDRYDTRRGQPRRRSAWNPGREQYGPSWGSYNQVGREWSQGAGTGERSERPDEWREHVEDTYDLEGGDPMGDRLMREDIAARRGFDRRRRREDYDASRSSGLGYREEDGPFMRSYPEADRPYDRDDRPDYGREVGRGRGDRPVGEPYFAEPRAGMSRGRTRVPGGRQGSGLQRRYEDTRRGPYSGVGPAGYVRSDERIREDISERLAEARDLDASGITVDVSGGMVTLSGTVRRKQDKWEAEDIAEDVTGVKDVHNQIRASRSLGARVADAVKDVFD